MNKRLINMDYLAWFFKQYQSIKNEINPVDTYRIAEAKKDVQGKVKFVIQIIGKADGFECYPAEIASEEKFLNGFSKKDMNLIFSSLSNNALVSTQKLHIHSQKFDETDGVKIYLKNDSDGQLVEKNLSEIISNKMLVKNLISEDAYAIGFLAGTESVLNEKIIISGKV